MSGFQVGSAPAQVARGVAMSEPSGASRQDKLETAAAWGGGGAAIGFVGGFAAATTTKDASSLARLGQRGLTGLGAATLLGMTSAAAGMIAAT